MGTHTPGIVRSCAVILGSHIAMARGYTEDEDYRPSRPARRVESQRGVNNPGFSAHYAVVWNIGIVILVFGFVTLFITLIYCMCICQETNTHKAGQPPPGELYWTHHWQKNFTIPELSTKQTTERWEDEDRFPEDNVSDTSSRDYPRLYLESDYGQRTDRENDLDTDLERAERAQSNRYESRDREESPHRY